LIQLLRNTSHNLRRNGIGTRKFVKAARKLGL